MGASLPGEDRFTVGPGGAASWRVRANLTWEALAPTTAEFLVSVIPFRSCGDGCIESVGPGYTASGPSPLELAADLQAPSEADGLWLNVRQPLIPTPAGLVGVWTPQDFRLDGMAWHAAPRDGSR